MLGNIFRLRKWCVGCKQLTVVSENKPGVIAVISGALGKVGVNIDSISSEGFGEGAVTRIVTRDPQSAKEVLKRASFKVTESSLLVVAMLDRPGELGKVSGLLTKAGVNIENIFMLTKKNNEVIFAFHVDKEEVARKTLAHYLQETY